MFLLDLEIPEMASPNDVGQISVQPLLHTPGLAREPDADDTEIPAWAADLAPALGANPEAYRGSRREIAGLGEMIALAIVSPADLALAALQVLLSLLHKRGLPASDWHGPAGLWVRANVIESQVRRDSALSIESAEEMERLADLAAAPAWARRLEAPRAEDIVAMVEYVPTTPETRALLFVAKAALEIRRGPEKGRIKRAILARANPIPQSSRESDQEYLAKALNYSEMQGCRRRLAGIVTNHVSPDIAGMEAA